MPSPFPGMDPYIEGQAWADFHARMIATISEMLVPSLRPRYAIRVEERIYLEHEMEGQSRHIRPDLLIARSADSGSQISASASVGTAIQPIEITLPMPEEVVERYLTIEDMTTHEVVTVIELLSPSNKRPGSDGREQYLEKRVNVLKSRTNLVEIDLLRGGARLPTDQVLPPAEYYAIVCRGRRRPAATAYPMPIRRALPTIPIPLSAGDADVELDLQMALTTTYDRGGYDYSLEYAAPVEPPLSEADVAWARDILKSRE